MQNLFTHNVNGVRQIDFSLSPSSYLDNHPVFNQTWGGFRNAYKNFNIDFFNK